MYIVPYCTVYLNHVYSTLQYTVHFSTEITELAVFERSRSLHLNAVPAPSYKFKLLYFYKSLNLSNLKQKSFLRLIFLCIVWKLYAENNYQYGLFWGVWKLKKCKCQYYTILYRAGPGSRAWAEPDRKRSGSATLISIAHSVELTVETILFLYFTYCIYFYFFSENTEL